jgi:uncharacterized protein YecT (DUF1311 family)
MRTYTIFTTLFSFFLGTAFAQAPEKMDTIQPPNSCNDYIQLKKDMDDLVKKINTEYAKDAAFMAKFKKTQAAWLTFRDAQMDMIFPETDKKEYGTLYYVCRCNWLIEITTHRYDFLLKWISNFDTGEACGGSINSKKRKSYVKLND